MSLALAAGASLSYEAGAALVTALATCVLVLVTARYVRLTRHLVLSAAEDRRLGVLPALTLRVHEVAATDHRAVYVSLENIGNGLARAMRLELGFERRGPTAATSKVAIADHSLAAGARMWFAAPASSLHAGPMSLSEIQTTYDVLYLHGHARDLTDVPHRVSVRMPVAALAAARLTRPPDGYLPSPR